MDYPGATPETVAANIATPLERQFMQIPGLEMITSKSSQGFCSLTLQFALSKSLDGAATDVQAAIARAAGNLPVDLPSPPTFTKTNPNDQPIMFIAVYSDSMTSGQIYDIANTQIGQRISILSGVSQVQVSGRKRPCGSRPIRRRWRPAISPSMTWPWPSGRAPLTRAPASSTAPAGHSCSSRRGNSSPRRITTSSSSERATARRSICGTWPRPRDSVQDERMDMRFWFEGGRCLRPRWWWPCSARRARTRLKWPNPSATCCPRSSPSCPLRWASTLVHDRSETIVRSVEDVQETLVIAFVLVVMVIFMFLGRATDTLIPVVALPLSMLLTFIVMNVLGYSLDNLSLMAMTLAIGFLVDDAIVFLENTVRRMEQYNETPVQAAIEQRQGNQLHDSLHDAFAGGGIPAVGVHERADGADLPRVRRDHRGVHPGQRDRVADADAADVRPAAGAPRARCEEDLRRAGDRRRREARAAALRRVAVAGPALHPLAILVWLGCLVGTGYLLWVMPKAFLPTGDSSFIWGMFFAQEGVSPAEMHSIQDRGDEVLQANGSMRTTFTMSGNGQFLGSNIGALAGLLEDPEDRPPLELMDGRVIEHPSIQDIAQQLTMGLMMRTQGVMPIFTPQPVLEISTGVSARPRGSSTTPFPA